MHITIIINYNLDHYHKYTLNLSDISIWPYNISCMHDSADQTPAIAYIFTIISLFHNYFTKHAAYNNNNNNNNTIIIIIINT